MDAKQQDGALPPHLVATSSEGAPPDSERVLILGPTGRHLSMAQKALLMQSGGGLIYADPHADPDDFVL